MSLIDKVSIQSGSLTATTTGSSVTFARPKCPPPYGAVLTLSAIGAGTSLVVKIQHSADNTNWFDLATFAAKTATGSELINVTVAVLPYLRSVHTFTGGTTTCTSTVDLWHGVEK